MIKLYFIFYILRIQNLFIAGTAVLISCYLLNEPIDYLVLPCIFVVIATMNLGNIMNDFLDIKTDIINNPNKVLLNNIIKKEIIIICFISGVILFLCSLNFNQTANVLLFFFIIPCLVLYNFYFKKKPLIGNIVVAALLGSVFLFTESIITQTITRLYIPFFLAFGLSLLREITKDLYDYKGDKTAHMKTLPIAIGIENTNYLLIGFIIIAIGMFTTPYIYFNYSIQYLYFLTIFIEIPLIYSLFLLIKIPSKRTYKHIVDMLKLLNMIGLLIIMITKS